MTESPDPRTLFIVDAHNLLYKAHFAFQQRPLTTRSGRDVSVVFGFVRMLMRLFKDNDPSYLVMAFDMKGPTFRHALYEQYKVNRPPMPAPIAENIPDIKDIVRAFGIKILEQPGYEADDILGSIVHQFAHEEDIRVVMITGDKDMLQLVNDRVTVLTTKSGVSDTILYDRKKVLEKYGVPPEKMLDYFSMIGDASDNVPGIHGVGPKTAVKLMEQFGSLEELYRRVEEVSSEKLREKILRDRDMAFMSRHLITLKTDADIPRTLTDYSLGDRDTAYLRRKFTEFEFKSLVDELGAGEPAPDEPREYRAVQDKSTLLALVGELRKCRVFAIDTETTSISPTSARLVGISVSMDPHSGHYIPVGHRTQEPQLSLEEVRTALNSVLRDPTIQKTGHNIKYDWIVLERHGFELKGVTFDTMIASYVTDPGRRQHNLDALSQEHLHITKIPTSSLIGKESPYDSMALVPLQQVAEYACEDSDATLRLYNIFKEMVDSGDTRELFEEIEMPLVRILAEMEMTGIRLDTDLLEALSLEVSGKIDELTEEIYILAGEEFNINSPKQLGEILFDKLQYPTKGLKKTKTGYSTAERELMKLASEGGLFRELPEKILDYRGLTKLKNTYIDTLPEMINPDTGRIHTSFNQTVTETGRLSSSDPNLQNIPIRSTLGREIRRAFIPRDGWRMMSADYSQMELRILAHVADDAAMIEAFHQGRDIHAATAARIFNVAMDAVTPEQRRRAKMVNFGIDYGMTPFGLSERLGISVADARRYIKSYMDNYTGIRKYIESVQEHVQAHGWVETLSGRRRMIPMAQDSRRNIREAAFRQAVNMPIQGTAADIMKIAMIRIHAAMTERNLAAKMLLQVHDELIFELPPDETGVMEEMVRELMESAFTLKVPLTAELSFGPNWAEIH